MANPKKEQLDPDDLVYYTHPDGHVQEMTRAERDELENKQSSPDQKMIDKKQIVTR